MTHSAQNAETVALLKQVVAELQEIKVLLQPKPKKQTKKKAQRSPQDAQDRAQAARALDYLNRLARKNYQPVDANLDMIVARFREGLKATNGNRRAAWLQIQVVIDHQVDEWLGDERMEQYLRPSTLFGATNFWTKYAGKHE